MDDNGVEESFDSDIKPYKTLSFTICILQLAKKFKTRETPVIDHIPLAYKHKRLVYFIYFMLLWNPLCFSYL